MLSSIYTKLHSVYKMVAHYSWLVFMLTPFLANGLLTGDNVELIQSLAADLGFSCITVIVEDVDKININVKEKLTKQDFPAIISKMEDLEKIFKLVKIAKNNCLNFIYLSDGQLQAFLDSITSRYPNVLEESSWFLWMNNENIELDPKLVGLRSDVNLILEKAGLIDIKEVFSLSPAKNLLVNKYGSYNRSAGLSWIQKDRWTRRNNLHGLLLKGIVLEDPGYLEINAEVSAHNSP